MTIPQDVIRFFAGKLRMGYLASRRPDGHLAVVPLGVMIHEGKVRISSPSETFKLRNIRHDPHVAVCVPDPEDGWRYLMIRGTAEVADDADLSFLNWLAREHMGLEAFPKTVIARSVITILPVQFTFGGTHED
jgi:PPOX class probable F420-dependent enzyme